MSDEVKKVSSKSTSTDMPIGEIFSESWNNFSKNFSMLIVVVLISIGLTLVPVLIAFLGGMSVFDLATSLTGYNTNVFSAFGGVSLLLVALTGVFVATWTAGASTYAAYNVMQGKKVTAWENYTMALKKFWVFLGVTILVGLIVGVGIVLLVLPGIAAAIFLAYTMYLIPAENLTISKAISRSFELAKKSWTVILVAMILLMLISVVLSWIPFLNMIIAPLFAIFTTLVIASLYNRVK